MKFSNTMTPVTLRRFFVAAVILSWATLSPETTQAQEDWVKVLPPGIKYRVQMPVEPRLVERTMTPTEDSSFTIYQYFGTVNEGKLTYVFSHNDLIVRPIGDKQLAERLDQHVHGNIVRVNGELVSQEAILYKKYLHGREFVFTFSDREERKYKIHARVYIDGGKMYELKVASFADDFDEAGAQKFFESMGHSPNFNPPKEAGAPAEDAGN